MLQQVSYVPMLPSPALETVPTLLFVDPSRNACQAIRRKYLRSLAADASKSLATLVTHSRNRSHRALGSRIAARSSAPYCC